MTATHGAVAPLARFKPTRAGIINLWDYFDEEFAFGDGRLALRGHNGSGKTKALEVLFPFVLDGGLDARRLDPFSGENRTMKANLLYRGQDAEHGYVWMEFGRPAETTNAADPADASEPANATEPSDQQETVTLVIGLTAHKNWERARPSFFITDQRMGVDFGLLSADSRPLTAKQLTAILGREASFGDRRGAYQDAVDTRLFGLGRERYTQLLDLLIALRRPLAGQGPRPGQGVRHPVGRPQPGRRRPGRAGRARLRKPGRRPEAVRRPGRRRRGGPRLPDPVHRLPPRPHPAPG